MKSCIRAWLPPIALATMIVAGSLLLRHVAFAQGAAEVAPLDAGVMPAPDAAVDSPGLSHPGGADLNPLSWPWDDILLVVMTTLGSLVALLRVLAPMTASTKDDWLLRKLEWLTDLLAKIVVPKQYRSGSKTA